MSDPISDQVAVDLGSDLVTYAVRLIRAVRRTAELPAGFRVVSLLDEHGPLGITRLAALDRCSQPTMSGAVRDLVAKGLVDKQPHPDDARSSVVTLTEHGREELVRVRRRNGEIVAARLPDPARGRSELAAAVGLLRELLDTGFLAGAPTEAPTEAPTKTQTTSTETSSEEGSS